MYAGVVKRKWVYKESSKYVGDSDRTVIFPLAGLTRQQWELKKWNDCSCFLSKNQYRNLKKQQVWILIHYLKICLTFISWIPMLRIFSRGNWLIAFKWNCLWKSGLLNAPRIILIRLERWAFQMWWIPVATIKFHSIYHYLNCPCENAIILDKN